MNITEAKKAKSEMMSELFKKCGVFFAFSNQQFEENKTPLLEGEKYISLPGGGYVPGRFKEMFLAGMDEIKKVKATKPAPAVYDVAEFEPDEKKVKEYQEKQEARADRFQELAEKAEKQSEQAFKTAHQIGSFIPMGQPILVGHHSEGRHRRDLAKIDNNMRKSIELDEKAKYYAEKAENAANSYAIRSDDPEAIVELIEKYNGLVKNQELMKNANKVIKNQKLQEVEKVEQLQNLGLTEKQAIEIMAPRHFGGPGFPSFSLTNNNANIRSTQQRIEQLRKQQTQETKETEIGGVKIVDNVEDNRLQLFFDGKPDEKTRTELKRNGFRLSPSVGCWQSYRGQYQMDRAKKILAV